MKHFAKRIHTILYGMHDLLWVVIGLFLLLGVILIASTDSWLYLILLLPFLVYVYRQKVPSALKIRVRTLEQNLGPWSIKFISYSKKTASSLRAKIRKLEQNLEPLFIKFVSHSKKTASSLNIKIRRLEQNLELWLIKFISTVKRHQVH
jgi:hypothetical protein